MKNAEKEKILDLPSVGYWSALDGVEVKQITSDDDGNEVIICVSGAWYGGKSNKRVHKLKVKYNKSGDQYVEIYQTRLHLDECLRTGLN